MTFVKRYPPVVFAFLLASSVFLAGCFEDNTQEFSGDPVVEFAPGGPFFGPGSTQFGTPNNEGEIIANISSGFGSPEGGMTDLLVQLLGEQRSNPLTVNYTISDSLTTVSGDVFSVGDGSGTVTIPADSSSARIPLSVSDFLEPNSDQSGRIGITLQGNEEEGVGVANNYRTYVINVSPRRGDIGTTFIGDGSSSFGTVPTDGAKVDTFAVRNTGDASLTVDDISINDNTAFQVIGTTSFELPADPPGPGNTPNATVHVRFEPPEAQFYNATLTVESNDADEGTVEIGLTGTGVVPEDDGEG